jgi:ABC-2 type transport system permease protein
MNSRLASILRKEFIQITRDKRTLVIILIIPIMQLFLLGYSATSDVRNVPLAVYDQCRCTESRSLLDAYRAADYFRLAYMVGSENDIRLLIERGDARAGIIIPPDYNTALAQGKAEVAFILDGSDATAGSTALSAATLIGQSQATQLMIQRLERSGLDASNFQPPLQVRTRVWYNPDLVSSHFMIPGVIGMILYAITSILTATAVVRERERGTIEQLIVTPIRPWELVVGKILPYAILAFIDTLEVLAIGHWWFGMPVRGDLGLILACSGLLVLSVRLHHCQHPAGGHADGLDDAPAEHLPLRVFLPAGGHAEIPAVDFLHHPITLLPDHHPRLAYQGGWSRAHLE